MALPLPAFHNEKTRLTSSGPDVFYRRVNVHKRTAYFFSPAVSSEFWLFLPIDPSSWNRYFAAPGLGENILMPVNSVSQKLREFDSLVIVITRENSVIIIMFRGYTVTLCTGFRKSSFSCIFTKLLTLDWLCISIHCARLLHIMIP